MAIFGGQLYCKLLERYTNKISKFQMMALTGYPVDPCGEQLDIVVFVCLLLSKVKDILSESVL
jgi:hypothetical protein